MVSNAGGSSGSGRGPVPFAFGNSCNSWPLGVRLRLGGQAVCRCQSEVWPLRQPETGRLRWTWRRYYYGAADHKHSLGSRKAGVVVQTGRWEEENMTPERQRKYVR